MHSSYRSAMKARCAIRGNSPPKPPGMVETLVKMDRWYPSRKRCFECGHVLDALPLEILAWDCPECGMHHNRDVNAAKHMVVAGQAVLACGEAVRPGTVKTKPGEAGTPTRVCWNPLPL